MAETNKTHKTYRIRTKISEEPSVINLQLNQTYDMFEILSLKLDQKNAYKYYESDYGIIVGRVVANGNFGVPNAKISVFIEVEDDETLKNRLIYNFTSVQDVDNDGVRYNTLPDYVDNICHQDVGTFPNKRLVLDNDDVLEMFDKYWKYTTTTNESGDYMLYGIPTGNQKLHVDVDLSDIGVLSQRPRDMVYKGYNINQFESPNKFKESTNLNSLAQIYTQDRGVYVYPYWGETNENGDNIAITRCDIQLEYKFEPTAIFIGSIVTDKGNNAINQGCNGSTNVGRMSDLVAGEGSIEMIRKTIDNKVEEFQIKGNRLIDGDGVWCYQIPMNLDYVMTDEFGNIVPTDDPSRGIPTRTRVRFRISVDETVNDGSARKRCKYLVPNNPRIHNVDYPKFTETLNVDYEFGSATEDENYRDLFWNNVYTVKNYIPKLQKNNSETNRKHTGIKWTNHSGDNNPMPFNSLTIKLGFMYRLICVLTKVIINLIEFLNQVISMITAVICLIVQFLESIECFKLPLIGKVCILRPIIRPIRKLIESFIPSCIGLTSEFCDDGVNRLTYYPGCGMAVFNLFKINDCIWEKTKKHHMEKEKKEGKDETSITQPVNSTAKLYNCVENNLAQDNDVTSFNFNNDWVNGVLYFPLWYRKITPKKSFLFGLFKRRAKDQWCSSDKTYGNLRIYETCSLRNKAGGDLYKNFDGEQIIPYWKVSNQCGEECHEQRTELIGMNGVIVSKDTMLGQKVFYYKPIEYDYSLAKNDFNGEHNGGVTNGEIKLLFATDIVLLGSLNDCDLHGIPQFFKYLEPSTYNLPNDILDTDQTITISYDETGEPISSELDSHTVESGCDWGNTNTFDQCGSPDGGLFYSIGCSTIKLQEKSCVNLRRICEFGVSKDVTRTVENLPALEQDENDEGDLLIPDGYVSYDELFNLDQRSMFATMNGNNLKTKLNKTNGLLEYDFRYLYPENFDGSLEEIMKERQTNKCTMSYRYNYNLESFSADYYRFRMGNVPYFYGNDGDKHFPRFENSFYFYFGLKNGKSAIEKFNSEFFSSCEDVVGEETKVGINVKPNSWCSDGGSNDGFVEIDVTGIETPYDIIINSNTEKNVGYKIEGVTDEKIIICEDDVFNERKTEVNGYEYVQIELEDGVKSLDNGEYELVITDANGNISDLSFSLRNQFLTYKVSKENFLISNEDLLEKYKTNDGILNGGDKDKLGKIIINNVVFNNKPLSDFVIEIRCDDINYNIREIKNGYNGEELVYNMPLGGYVYKVIITQLCDDGSETLNVVITNVLVEKLKPFKMFINDIDYDLISEWEDGYNNTSINGKEPVQWLNLSSKKYYCWEKSSNVLTLKDKVLDLIKAYGGTISTNTSNQVLNILSCGDGNGSYSNGSYNSYTDGKNTLLTNIKNIANVTDNDFDTELSDIIDELLDYKQETINTMVSKFRIVCNEQSQDLTITAQSNFYPVEYRIFGRVEETYQGDEVEGTLNTFVENELVDGFEADVYQITDIRIPTISTVESVNFGNESYYVPNSNNKLCYATCNIYENSRKLKVPYYCGIRNVANEMKPMNVSFGDKHNDTYFRVHFIDKIFSFKMMAWSYIDDIPYFKPTNTDLYGKSISMNGLVTGLIMNGVINGYYDKNKGIVSFYEQQLGANDLEIVNFELDTADSSYEDKMPTKRTITGFNYGEYKDYKITGDAPNAYLKEVNHYASVPNKLVEISVADENGCSITDNVYGSMKINLDSISVNDCINNKKVLKVSCSNGGSGIKFYIFSAAEDGTLYPLNNVEVDESGLFTIQMYGINEWDGNGNSDLFSHLTVDGIKEGTFYESCVDSIKSQETLTNELEPKESKGWGTTGLFNIGNKDNNYYIIATNDSNCRTISPVYCYMHIDIEVGLGVVHSKNVVDTPTTGSGGSSSGTGGESGGSESSGGETSGSETETGGGTDSGSGEGSGTTPTPPAPTVEEKEEYVISFKVKDERENLDESRLYYFEEYEYIFKVLCLIDEFHRIEAETTINPGYNEFMNRIDEDTYKFFKKYLKNDFTKMIMTAATTAELKDVTGLRHLCKAVSFEEKEWFMVTFDPNGGYWDDNKENVISRVFYITKDDERNTIEKLLDGSTVSKEGSNFLEWKDMDGGTGGEISGSKVFVAQWDGGGEPPVETATILWKVDSENGGQWMINPRVIDQEDLVQQLTNEQLNVPQECPKGYPGRPNGYIFDGWKTDDETVIIENNKVKTDHDCVVYPIWDKLELHIETDKTEVDADGGLVKISYWVSSMNGKVITDGITLEDITDEAISKLSYTNISEEVIDGKIVKIIEINGNSEDIEKYLTMQADYQGMKSSVTIKQLAKEEEKVITFDTTSAVNIRCSSDGYNNSNCYLVTELSVDKSKYVKSNIGGGFDFYINQGLQSGTNLFFKMGNDQDFAINVYKSDVVKSVNGSTTPTDGGTFWQVPAEGSGYVSITVEFTNGSLIRLYFELP